jgi:ABC-type polysaccharide/polyol phosphate export permease
VDLGVGHEVIPTEEALPVLRLTKEPTPPLELIRGLWGRRRLILMLARKDFFARYRRASFGVLWAALLPFLQTVVLSVVGTFALKVKTPGVDYPLFIFSGLVGYNYFTATISSAGTSIVDNASLASKIYFPRATLVLAAVCGNAYTGAINVVFLLILAGIVRAHFGVETLLIIPAAVLVILLAASASLVLAGLHVYFRDVRFLVQAVLTVLLYFTPVFYSESRAPRILRWFLVANPLTGVVEIIRKAFEAADPNWQIAPLITLAWTAVFAVLAIRIHSRNDRVFTDLL